MGSDRVRPSDSSIVPPHVGSGSHTVVQPDPQTVANAVQDRFLGTEVRRDVGKIETPRVSSRNFSDIVDPKFARLAIEVLARATVLAMAQIDEPKAEEGQPPPSGTGLA